MHGQQNIKVAILCCVKSKKSANPIYIAAEAWNHAELLCSGVWHRVTREVPTFLTNVLFPSPRGTSVPRKSYIFAELQNVTSPQTAMRTPVSEIISYGLPLQVIILVSTEFIFKHHAFFARNEQKQYSSFSKRCCRTFKLSGKLPYTVRYFPTFRGNVMPPSSGSIIYEGIAILRSAMNQVSAP